MCSCSSTTAQPRLACLSACAHTLMQAAVCCLHDVLRTYPGAACAAAPLRRRSLDWLACLRVRIHSYEQLCAVSMMCCVHNWEQHVLLLLMTTQPGTFCLSPYAHMRAAACCLHITAAPIVRKHASCFVSSCAVTARGLLVRADLHPLMHVHRVPGDLVARFVHLSKPATSMASPRGCCCTQATASRAGWLRWGCAC